MRKSRLSSEKQNHLIEHFVAGSTARTVASLLNINRTTVTYYFHRLRLKIYDNYKPLVSFEEDLNLKGILYDPVLSKKHNGQPIFALIKIENRIHVLLLDDEKSKANVNDIEKYSIEAIVFARCLDHSSTLSLSHLHFLRVNPQSSRLKNNIDNIENFWKKMKNHMHRFNGVSRKNFLLYIIECDWRFNGGEPRSLFFQLKEWVHE